ncbi:MAG TPA: sigma-70 family RNA polymerase sigma factor [Urbifossiella sp.]|jgi:RNA polymerase sigma factor (sigma-70 family)|nr:sigma-70 family RNA polymerase sigma factor [Urbifossiella sp.]
MPSLAARLRFTLADPPTDADLLARFVAGRDGEAFAELVRRHGPAVLAVCRRVSRHAYDADDAFQAAFLVLARRATQVRPGEPLAAWLYGVAVRVARKAADRPWRRREVPGNVPDVPERTAELFDPDAARAVADEVGRLSPRYRAAVVLCELEGRPRAAAARELGIAEGTLSSRLAAARKQLAARLTARGLAPTAPAVLAGVVVPPGLAAAASALATGGPAPAGVAALAHGVNRAMLLHKLKAVPVVIGLFAAAALAAGSAAGPGAVPRPAPVPARVAVAQPPAPKAAPRPLPKGPNKILIYKNGRLVLLDPDGKNEKQVTEVQPDSLPSTDAKLSPDGTRVAYLAMIGKPGDTPPDQPQRRKLYLRTVGATEPPTDTRVECDVYVWSPDGSRLAASGGGRGGAEPPELSHSLVDARTGERTPLKLPSNHIITGWLADGDRLLTTSMAGPETAPRVRLHLMNLDGTEHKALTDGKTLTGFGLPSPDGKKILCMEMTPPGKDGPPERRRTLVLLDAATGKRTPVEGLPLNGDLQGFCWSPDGRRMAYTWRQVHEGTPEERLRKETESHLVVADPDGKNPRTILTEKADGQWFMSLGTPDWR